MTGNGEHMSLYFSQNATKISSSQIIKQCIQSFQASKRIMVIFHPISQDRSRTNCQIRNHNKCEGRSHGNVYCSSWPDSNLVEFDGACSSSLASLELVVDPSWSYSHEGAYYSHQMKAPQDQAPLDLRGCLRPSPDIIRWRVIWWINLLAWGWRAR